MSKAESEEVKEIVIVIKWSHIAIACILIVALAALSGHIKEFFSPKFQISTSRTVYRPGSIVEFKGVLKVGFEPVRNMPIAVEVRDPRGNIVWVDQATTDENGCFVIRFKLSSKAMHGVYTIYVSCKVARAKYTFEVG